MTNLLGRGELRSASALVMRGGTFLIGARITRMVISMAALAVLARLLEPADFGVLAFCVSFLVMARAITEPILDIPAIRDPDLTTVQYRAYIWWALAVALAMAGLFAASSPLLGAVTDSPAVTQGAQLLAPALFMQAIYLAGNSMLRRRHQFGRIAAISISNLIVSQGLTIALAVYGFGWRSLVLGQLFSIGLFAVQNILAAKLDWRPPASGLSAIRPSGMAASGVGVINWAMTSLDTLFTAAMLGPAATGLYSRAYNLITQLKEPFAEIDVTLRQAFGMSADQQAGEVYRQKVRSGLRLLALIAALAAGGLVALREQVVLIILSEKWLPIIPALTILAFGFPLRIARLYMDSITVAWGSMRSLLGQRIILVVLLVAMLVWAAQHGIAYIAGAITLMQLVSVSLQGSAAEGRILPSLLSRFIALLPGYILFGAMVGAAEAAAQLAGPQGLLIDIIIRGGAAGLVALIAILITPGNWLIGPVRRMRARLPGFAQN